MRAQVGSQGVGMSPFKSACDAGESPSQNSSAQKCSRGSLKLLLPPLAWHSKRKLGISLGIIALLPSHTHVICHIVHVGIRHCLSYCNEKYAIIIKKTTSA